MLVKHGQHEGKIKSSCRKVLKTGRENTLYERGIKMSEKKWNDKVNKEGYMKSIKELDEAEPFITPMLAQKVEIKNNKIKGMKFPLYVQPKLDGFRCWSKLVNNEVELYSRKNISYKGLGTLKSELLKLYSKLTGLDKKVKLDGELYIHGIPFEDLNGLIKRAQHNCQYDLPKVEFRIFDCFNLDNISMSFEDRTKFLKSIIPEQNFNVKYVRTEVVNTLDEFKNYFLFLLRMTDMKE